MTNQELADAIQKHIAKSRKLLTEAEQRACNGAATGCEATTAALPHLTAALAASTTAHAETTKAAVYMPDVTPQFGDK